MTFDYMSQHLSRMQGNSVILIIKFQNHDFFQFVPKKNEEFHHVFRTYTYFKLSH